VLIRVGENKRIAATNFTTSPTTTINKKHSKQQKQQIQSPAKTSNNPGTRRKIHDRRCNHEFYVSNKQQKKQNKPLHLPACLAAVAVVLPWLAWPLAVVARHFFCFVVGTMLSDIT
jgi:hypothetical protein